MVSFLNGLSSLGAATAQFAGAAGLETQRAQLAQQAQVLADQLATNREINVTQPFQKSQLETSEAGANTRNAATNTTSLATNAASNETSLATNAATNATSRSNNAASNAGEMARTQLEVGKPTGELQMARALAGPDPTPEQLNDALVTVLSGRAKYQSSPAVAPDPDDPSKTISGVNIFNTRTGETEFRRTDTNPNKPGAGGQGNRAELQFNRITAAGNAASKAVENIMELPATTSTGWFAGAGQGTGLLAAAKNVLTNAATSQDVQSFKVMATGVGRNMATLETQGLAPPQGFAKSMESTMLAEGDTQETKLRKMAEMRQIIEANLEPSLANPKIPPEQKALVSQIINKVTTAIPFTQHDITMLSQAKNPATTMADVMKARGLGPSGVSKAAPVQPDAVAPQGVGDTEVGFSPYALGSGGQQQSSPNILRYDANGNRVQ